MPQANGLPLSPDERAAKKRPTRIDPITDLPPQDLAAERGVLASAFYCPWHLDRLQTILSPDDFYAEDHRKIYAAMLTVHGQGRRLEDPKVVYDQLKKLGQLEECGGIAGLMEIAQSSAHGENAEYYAQLVKDAAIRRDLRMLAYQTYQQTTDSNLETRDLITRLETGVGDLHSVRTVDKLHIAGDVAGSSMHRVLCTKKTNKVGIKSGIAALDVITNGYCRKHYVTIAARTSVGKTALLTSHIAHWWQHTDAVGFLATMEMTEAEVMDRIICNMATLDTWRFNNHLLDGEEISRLKECTAFMQANKRLWIDDSPRRTLSEIVSQARRVKRASGRLDYVAIDYLQLLDSPLRYAKRHEQIADITRGIKIAAKELDVPFIVPAQLNRDAEGGSPKLSHLRESGSIEQDSDVVVFIDRRVNEDGEGGAEAELIVAKNRNGRIGKCRAAFFANFQRFATMHSDSF